MKKYLVFYMECYYPGGGMKDLYANTDDLDRVLESLYNTVKGDNDGVVQIVDVENFRVREIRLDSVKFTEKEDEDRLFPVVTLDKEDFLNKAKFNTMRSIVATK